MRTHEAFRDVAWRLALFVAALLSSAPASFAQGGGCIPPTFSAKSNTLDVFAESSGSLTDIGDIEIDIYQVWDGGDTYCNTASGSRDLGWRIFLVCSIDIDTAWQSVFPDTSITFSGRRDDKILERSTDEFGDGNDYWNFFAFGFGTGTDMEDVYADPTLLYVEGVRWTFGTTTAGYADCNIFTAQDDNATPNPPTVTAPRCPILSKYTSWNYIEVEEETWCCKCGDLKADNNACSGADKGDMCMFLYLKKLKTTGDYIGGHALLCGNVQMDNFFTTYTDGDFKQEYTLNVEEDGSGTSYP